ncbi:MAG: hypothetical protein M0R80_16405 [Proteobacteria bacterium]|nr:hypothetical protein [Pseudomonadota bacterium]
MSRALPMALSIAAFGLILGSGGAVLAAPGDGVQADRSVILGVAIRAGGRFDNVRMCVASPAGVKGGPAADISLFADIGVSDNASVRVNIPFMRPILFAAAFRMLQFEPEIGLIFRRRTEAGVDLVAGPTIGLSLHYGPDYLSEASGAGRRPSFFAMGPQVGGYMGLDFKRPDERFNFQLGLSPYVAPLFGVDDPDEHRGVVVGGLLDGWFRFST